MALTVNTLMLAARCNGAGGSVPPIRPACPVPELCES